MLEETNSTTSMEKFLQNFLFQSSDEIQGQSEKRNPFQSLPTGDFPLALFLFMVFLFALFFIIFIHFFQFI